MSDPFPQSISVALIGSLLMILLGTEGKNDQKPERTSASSQTEPEYPVGMGTTQLGLLIYSFFLVSFIYWILNV